MRISLSRKQKRTLDAIREHLEKHGYSPSYREIAIQLGLASPATIHEHVQALEAKGYLRVQKEGGRTIVLTEPGEQQDVGLQQRAGSSDSLAAPLVGLITAGEPIEAIETRETIVVPTSLIHDPVNTYVLKVKGESMRDEGILDGDYVIVERNPSPSDGDVVVALLDNAYATLKRFFREKDRIRLQPANPTMSPIYCFNPTIQGVVRGVIRKFASASAS
jgi:repressor LexA